MICLGEKIDAICSIARHVPIEKGTWVTKHIPAQEGVVVLAKVLNDKKFYNRLETKSGRTVQIKKGNTYALVLGNRNALEGYVGIVPNKIMVGDIVNILNIGGICGQCLSANVRYVGSNPFSVKILGALEINGTIAHIKDFAPIRTSSILKAQKKLIVISGTCMNVGKTYTACEVIRLLTVKKKKVSAAKLTGAGCMRDVLRMKKFGARFILDLVDAGLVSTCTKKHTLEAAKGIVNSLESQDVDYIVLEIGDGVISKYHGKKILYDPEFQNNMLLSITCARDLTGAWGLKMLFQRHGCPLHLFGGPVTNNIAGSSYIEKRWKIPAVSALYEKEKFQETFLALLKQQ